MRSNRWEGLRRNRSKSQRNGHLERLHQAQLFELAEKQTQNYLTNTDFKICALNKKQPNIAARVPDISYYYQRTQFSLNYHLSSNDTADNQIHSNSCRLLSRSRSRSHSFHSSSKDSDSSVSSNSSLDYPPKKQQILSHPVSHTNTSVSHNTISLTVVSEQNLSQNKFFTLLDRIETLITGQQTITKASFYGSFNDNFSLLVPMKILSLETNPSILELNFRNRKSSFPSIMPYLQKQERQYITQFKIQEKEKQSQKQLQIEIKENQNQSLKKEQKQEKNEVHEDPHAEDTISQKSNALSLLQFETLMKLAFANKDLQFIQLMIPSHTSFLLSRALSKIHEKKLHMLQEFECISSGYLPSKELLDQLKNFPLLKKINLSEVIPSDTEIISSFNALLQKVDSLEVNFEEITLEAASLLDFKEQYDKVIIFFKIDIITNPGILDAFLAAVSKIKSVNQLNLTNTFDQHEYCGTEHGSTFRDLKIIIKQLELDLGLAKQIDYSQYFFSKGFLAFMLPNN